MKTNNDHSHQVKSRLDAVNHVRHEQSNLKVAVDIVCFLYDMTCVRHYDYDCYCILSALLNMLGV